MAIFSLIMVIAALPFKMTQASVAFGAARIDRLENVRTEFHRLLADVRAGTHFAFSDAITLASGARAYRGVQLTDPDGRRVSYSWQPLDDNPTTEWRLVRDVKVGGASLPGYPKILVPRGVREFWLQPVPALDQAVPESTLSRTVLGYIVVYPDDAPRPLAAAGGSTGGAGAPIELGSGVTLRNEALR